jgi:hypothetical protein
VAVAVDEAYLGLTQAVVVVQVDIVHQLSEKVLVVEQVLNQLFLCLFLQTILLQLVLVEHLLLMEKTQFLAASPHLAEDEVAALQE